MTMNAEMAIKHVLHDLPTAATATFLALFPIVNPFGGIPLFFSLTTDFAPEERRRTALFDGEPGARLLEALMLWRES
jgi:small neutral amino acid transporter SnatA (MarC family)